MNAFVVQTFMELCRIDSPTGHEDAVAAYVMQHTKPYADVVKQDAYGNVYVRFEGTGDPLFFSAHMDTVEPGRGIVPKQQDGYIVSSGDTILGADNKAAIAVLLAYARRHSRKHRTVEFVFTRSEEVGNYGAIAFDYSLLSAKNGYCIDSSNPVGTIITASPYYERFDIAISGKEAHASRPDEAQNVLSPLTSILTCVPRGKVDTHTIVNIGVVSTGFVRNTIPGACRIEAEIRSYDEKELLLHKQNICDVLDMVRYRFSGDVSYEFVRENPGYLFTTETEQAFIKQTKQAMRACGLKPATMHSWGVSDANIFNDNGLLCVNLGDGSEFSHSVSERIAVDSLKKLETFVSTRCAV